MLSTTSEPYELAETFFEILDQIPLDEVIDAFEHALRRRATDVAGLPEDAIYENTAEVLRDLKHADFQIDVQ
jgi:hypothetical protein